MEIGEASNALLKYQAAKILLGSLVTWIPQLQRPFEKAVTCLHKASLDAFEASEVTDSRKQTVIGLFKFNGMEPEECTEELSSLLVAGHETTAASMLFLSYLLARNPEMQEK